MSTSKRMRCYLTLVGTQAVDTTRLLPLLRLNVHHVERPSGICVNYETWVLEAPAEYEAPLKHLARLLGASIACAPIADSLDQPSSAPDGGSHPPAPTTAPTAPTE
jgi:hypothetical protein